VWPVHARAPIPFTNGSSSVELGQHPEEPVRQPANGRVCKTCPREQDDIDGERMYGLIHPGVRVGGDDLGAEEGIDGAQLHHRRSADGKEPRARLRQVPGVIIRHARDREGGINRPIKQHLVGSGHAGVEFLYLARRKISVQNHFRNHGCAAAIGADAHAMAAQLVH
jgi:hypothetical protein